MRKRPRVLIFAVVLLGHTATIFLLTVRIESQKDFREAEFLSLPIRLLPLLPPERVVQPKDDAVDPGPRVVPQPVDRPAIIVPEMSTAIAVPSVEPKPDSGSRLDWVAQAEGIARDFAAADPAKAPADAPARNIFESNSPRRAGYVEMIEPGIERRWINSRCYREFGRERDRVAGTRPDLNPVSCLMGSGPPRDDLFDHLKPEYLKAPE